MRRISLLMISGVLLAGCAGLDDARPSLWSLLEKHGQSEPKLTSYEQGKRDLQLGTFGLAITAFQKELTENPNSIPALNGLAVAYERLGRHDVAQRYLDLALTLDSKSRVTLNNLAYLNLTQGNSALALDYGERARAGAGEGDVKLPPSIAAAIANNFALAANLAMDEVRMMTSKETLAGVDTRPDIEQIGANEWALRAPPIKLSEFAQPPAATPRMPDSKVANWMTQISQNAVVRITNGTGRDQMATRFAGYLSNHGLKVRQLANAVSFNYKQSTIYYNPDQRDFALSLSRLLPFSIALVEARKGSGQIEIILGADLLGFDDDLRAA